MVLLGAVLPPLEQVIEDKRNVDPSAAKISYHTIKDAPTPAQPGAFTVQVKSDLYFCLASLVKAVLKEEDGNPSLSASNSAAAVAMNKWQEGRTHLLWVVKWAPKGLTPVTPKVALKASVVIPAKGALDVV